MKLVRTKGFTQISYLTKNFGRYRDETKILGVLLCETETRTYF